MLIHGLFGDLDNLKSLGTALTDHQVIRVDVPNHGQSPHWDVMNYQTLAQAMVELIDQLKIPAIHVVGHSLGGKIAMALALLFPLKVTSLTIADMAPVSYPPHHQPIFDQLKKLDLSQLKNRAQALQQLNDGGLDKNTIQFLLKNLIKTPQGFAWRMNLKGLEACYPTLIDWPLSQYQYLGPCLCIRGQQSNYVQTSHRHAFLSQFPNIQLKTIAATGHWLHSEKPRIFNRMVAEFINKNNHQG